MVVDRTREAVAEAEGFVEGLFRGMPPGLAKGELGSGEVVFFSVAANGSQQWTPDRDGFIVGMLSSLATNVGVMFGDAVGAANAPGTASNNGVFRGQVYYPCSSTMVGGPQSVPIFVPFKKNIKITVKSYTATAAGIWLSIVYS
jgi:hypothetical protein